MSILVTQPRASSQRGFAEGVARAIRVPSDGSGLEVTDSGLRIKALTERDLEVVADQIRREFPKAEFGKPEVAYVMDYQLHEPYYVATVVVPRENAEAVIVDLGSRRGMILSVSESEEEQTIEADLPVAESFGYEATLRSLTGGRGRLSFKHGPMRPAPSFNPNDDAA